MITVDAAAAINLARHELLNGAPANLVVLKQGDLIDALRFHDAPAHVISNGKILEPGSMRALASSAC
jgi:hypothetical protein